MSKSAATILLIDDDNEIRYSLNRVLSSRGYNIVEAASGEEGIEVAEKEQPDVIFLDNRMEGMPGIEALQHLRSVVPESMIVLMTAYGTTQTAIEAMKYGAFDYIIKPFDIKKVIALAEGAVTARLDLKQTDLDPEPLFNVDDYKEGIVGNSEPMQEVFKIIGQVAASDVTVLITGESGTGKELVARCIYQHSHRSGHPFIAVNCAAIPENLIESELFGHEKGSFTGATSQRIGKFELCDGGTIFLDEIGDMALPTQTKILRALQEGEIQRVGGSSTIKVDVRLITATNKPLEEMVAEKTFREDLYYRLNVVRIRLPSLRERLSDIPQLVNFMIQRLNKERKSHVKRVSSEAMSVLSLHKWPGNVRELENVIYRSAVIAGGDAILVKDLPMEVRSSAEGATRSPFSAGSLTTISESNASEASESTEGETVSEDSAPIDETATVRSLSDIYDELFAALNRAETDGGILSVIEHEMIVRALEQNGGNQVKASQVLGMTRTTLRKRIEQNDIRIG